MPNLAVNMRKEIACTKAEDKVTLDIWPFYEIGEKITCPRQIPGTSGFCANCQPGYVSIIVRETDEKHVLLDPGETPEWIKKE